MEKLKKLIATLLSMSIMLTAAGCQSKKNTKEIDPATVTVASIDTSVSYNKDNVVAQGLLMSIDIIKEQINGIAAETLDREDLDKVSVKNINLSNSIGLDLKIGQVKNIDKLNEFLKSINEVMPILGFEIDENLVAEISKDFKNIQTLNIKSSTQEVVDVDLENFTSINFLSLENVIATNIPHTITSIDFIGRKDPETGEVSKKFEPDVVLRQLGWLHHISNINFENMNVTHVSIPIAKSVSLTFYDCTGLTNVYISDSDYVQIENYNNDGINYNDITVMGKINNELIVVAPNYSVNTNGVKNNPKITYIIESPAFEVNYNNEPLEDNSLLVRK